MEKYSWTVEQIDELDFFRTKELEFGDWIPKKVDPNDVFYEYADQLPF